MNYRHAFHAGGFADVMKHALVARIFAHLAKKDAPYRYVDTHAGIGLYDLAADEARRTGEAADGIERMAAPFAPEVEAVLEPWRTALAAVRARWGDTAYPGSPALARELLRRQDRGVFVELHPADAQALTERYNEVANLTVLRLDGWHALSAQIPPKEKRGLVLVDPPYEKPGELDRLASAFTAAVAKWPTGVYAGWYPIKDRREVDRALAPLAELPRPGLRLELYVRDPKRVDRLVGSGLVVINPPWTLEAEARLLLPALAERLGREPGAEGVVTRIGAEP